MKSNPYASLDNLTAQLQGKGIAMPLSKFVELNLPVFKAFKKFGVPQKAQAEIVQTAINKSVSVSSLAVALSRLNTTHTTSSNVVIMEKQIRNRFVSKDAKLILGSQIEKVKIVKNGALQGFKEIQIDWRSLTHDESISSWIIEYKDKLTAINLTGWRWIQIAEAINTHLNLPKKISANTLTSVISLANKKIKHNT